MNEPLNSLKKTTRIIGVLYLLATATSMIGYSLLQSVTSSPDYLSTLYPHKIKVSLGVLFHLICDLAVVGIGVLMFGLFKKNYKNMAGWILSTRIIAGIVQMVGHISFLLLITVSKEFINAVSRDVSYYRTLGTLAVKWNAWAFEIAMISIGLGGLGLCYLLYTAKLVPRLISALGIIGYAVLFTRSILNILGYAQGFILFIPGGLFELIFPIWIIVKGFNPSQTTSQSND